MTTGLIVLFVALLFVLSRLGSAISTISTLRKSEAVLRQQVTSHYLIFQVDDSCYSQLENSTDGIIRISFTK